MENSTKIILKKYLEEKDFDKYNDTLKKEIKTFYVKKIQEKKSFFLYSNLLELLESVESFLDKKDIIVFTHFYDVCKSNYNPEILATYLTEIYEKIIL